MWWLFFLVLMLLLSTVVVVCACVRSGQFDKELDAARDKERTE